MRAGSTLRTAIAGAVVVSAGAASAGDEPVVVQAAQPACVADGSSRYTSCGNETIAAPAVCDLVGTVAMPDPAGDATPGSPLYVDVLEVNLHYLGNRVEVEWVTADTSFGGVDALVADGQVLGLAFDLDRDDSTGDYRSIPGVDLEVGVGPDYPGMADLNYFDEQGNWLPQELEWLPVEFTEDGFVLELDIHAHMLGSRQFDVAADTDGANGWHDSVTPTEVDLGATDASVAVRLRADQMAVEERPSLAAIQTATSSLQLSSELLYDGSTFSVDPSLVSYRVSHPRPDLVPDPSSVISVTPAGLAQFESDGFVVVRSQAECGAMDLSSEPLIIAGGAVFGDPKEDSVIAVFRTAYTPEGSAVSFGDMMTGFPDAMRVFNLQYHVTSELYDGYLPLAGDRQILSPIVADGLCGAPGNPMQTSPCCYMNCLDASPQYRLIHHEMGHNFQELRGMAQLLWDNDGRISASGFGECSASLPIIYFEEEVLENGATYGIEPGSYEHLYFESYRGEACAVSPTTLEEFEEGIAAGLISGIFDPGVTDGVGVYCSFFEQFTCGYVDGPNPYGHDSARRFLHVFGDRGLPGFVPEKVETYFGAAYSMAVGRDMRDKLRFWGFEIDDEYYDAIMPLIELRLRQAERRILHDSFETGDFDRWTVAGGKDVRVRRGLDVYGGTFDVAIEVAPCATEDDVELRGHTVSGLETFEACRSITCGSGFVVATDGEARLTAGDSIMLESESRVDEGGELSVSLDSSLGPFAHLQDDSPISEISYKVEFSVNLDDLTIGVGDEIEHFVAYAAGRAPILKLVLHSGPQMTLSARDSGGAWHSSSAVGLGPGWTKVSIAWEASDQASPSLTINDGAPTALPIIGTSGSTVESARWGVVGGTVASTSGVIRLDEFASWR